MNKVSRGNSIIAKWTLRSATSIIIISSSRGQILKARRRLPIKVKIDILVPLALYGLTQARLKVSGLMTHDLGAQTHVHESEKNYQRLLLNGWKVSGFVGRLAGELEAPRRGGTTTTTGSVSVR